MRIFKSLVALAGVTVLLLAGCTTKEQEIAVTGVKLSSTTLTLKVGETQTLTAEVEPSNANNKKVTWSTDDPDMNVISLNEGKVKGIAPGKATVTVTTDDGGKKATCEVTVTKEGETPGPGPDPGPGGDTEVLASSIELDITNGNTLAVGGTAVVKATVKPDNATNIAKIAWSSSDEKVATVAGSGKEATITAVAAGKATITASLDGKSGSVEVTVEEPDIPVSNITMKPASASLTVGDEETFQAYIEPANATNINSVEWKIDDPSLADLNPTGNYCKVTAKAAGTATLTATVEGKSASAEITIKAGGSSHPEVEGFVDLGLPSGALWGEKNLGASSAYEAGDYYAWGETETKYSYQYTESNYRWGYPVEWGGTDAMFEKYNENGLSILAPEDDAATVLLGEGFRTPTLAEWAELRNLDNCDWEWTTVEGIEGYLVKSKRNGKSIFIPNTGYYWYSTLEYPSSSMYYWISTMDVGTTYAYNFFHYLDEEGLGSTDCCFGQAIRPVYGQLPQEASSITVPETVEVEAGKPYKLTATVQPASAAKNLVWISYAYNISLNSVTGEVVVNYGTDAKVYAVDGVGGKKAAIELKVKMTYPTPEAVDMGFSSGTKWASWNLGATAPEMPGGYFAWGETEPKTTFYKEDYKWYNPETDSFTKYDDYNRFLTAEDDAANVHLGGDWAMPTREQVQEFISGTEWVTDEINGVKGKTVKSLKNGAKIFLPFAGALDSDGVVYGLGEMFFYHTKELYTDYYSYFFGFSPGDGVHDGYDARYASASIRPVLNVSGKSYTPATRSLGPVKYEGKSYLLYNPQERNKSRAHRGPDRRRIHK